MNQVKRKGWHALLTLVMACLSQGCDVKRIGEEGLLTFHPDNCGTYALGCSFDKPIAVGGSIEVRLSQNLEGEELMLRVGDSTRFDVKPTPSGASRTFEVTALSSGETALSAVNQAGESVDHVAIKAVDMESLRLRPFTNLSDEPDDSIDGVDTYFIAEGKLVSFWVGPDVGGEWQGMGRFSFALVEASAALEEAIQAEESTDIKQGFVAFRMPSGDQSLALATLDGEHVIQLAFVSD